VRVSGDRRPKVIEAIDLNGLATDEPGVGHGMQMPIAHRED
jgi:hypothetical protein